GAPAPSVVESPSPTGQGLGEVGRPPRSSLPGIPAALPHLMGGRSGTRAFPGRLPDPILSSPSAPPPPGRDNMTPAPVAGRAVSGCSPCRWPRRSKTRIIRKSRSGTFLVGHCRPAFSVSGPRTSERPDGVASRRERRGGDRHGSIPRPRWPPDKGVAAMGQSVVVLGAQWGDEGKGKIVDLLTEEI